MRSQVMSLPGLAVSTLCELERSLRLRGEVSPQYTKTQRTPSSQRLNHDIARLLWR